MAEELDSPAAPDLEADFLDNAEMTVDSKLRVGIPERFMKVLKLIAPEHADKVGIVPDDGGALKLLPYPAYVKRVAYWKTLNDRIAAHRTIKNFETSLAKLVSLDGQNRIKLTSAQADFCGIDAGEKEGKGAKAATIVGAVDCMKLYSRKGFQAMVERAMAGYASASDQVEREKEAKPAAKFVIEARPSEGA